MNHYVALLLVGRRSNSHPSSITISLKAMWWYIDDINSMTALNHMEHRDDRIKWKSMEYNVDGTLYGLWWHMSFLAISQCSESRWTNCFTAMSAVWQWLSLDLCGIILNMLSYGSWIIYVWDTVACVFLSCRQCSYSRWMKSDLCVLQQSHTKIIQLCKS